MQTTRGISPSGIAIGGQAIFHISSGRAVINARAFEGLMLAQDKNHIRVLLYGVVSDAKKLLFTGDVH